MDALVYILIALAVFVLVGFVTFIIICAVRAGQKGRDERGGKPYVGRSRGYLYYDEEDIKRLRGKQGEQMVQAVLGSTVPREKYVINEITVRDGDGCSFDIDHIYINRYGIWVIETKCYSGTVLGKEEVHDWIFTAKNGQQSYRYNPIKQNQTHLHRLKRCLNVNERIFHNIVVFTGEADIRVQSDKVCYIGELTEKVNKPTGVTLSVLEMERYYAAILELKKQHAVSNSEHVQAINDRMMKSCPECGAELTKMYSEDGTFLVCSNSPKCSFRKKVGKGWNE